MLGLLLGLAKQLVKPVLSVVGKDIKEEALNDAAGAAKIVIEEGEDLANSICKKCGFSKNKE